MLMNVGSPWGSGQYGRAEESAPGELGKQETPVSEAALLSMGVLWTV